MLGDGSRSFVRFTDVAAYGSRAFKGTMRRKEQVMNSVWPARSTTFWRRHSTRTVLKSYSRVNRTVGRHYSQSSGHLRSSHRRRSELHRDIPPILLIALPSRTPN